MNTTDSYLIEEEKRLINECMFFSTILEQDTLPLFLEYRDEITAYMRDDTLYWNMAYYFSEKILEHEAANGQRKEVIICLLQRCISQGTRQELLLRSICARTDSLSLLSELLLTQGTSLIKLRLLLELGVKPTQEQKEALRVQNSELYDALFGEDV